MKVLKIEFKKKYRDKKHLLILFQFTIFLGKDYKSVQQNTVVL